MVKVLVVKLHGNVVTLSEMYTHLVDVSVRWTTVFVPVIDWDHRLEVAPIHRLEPMPNLLPVHVFKRPYMVGLPCDHIILPGKFCLWETFHKQIIHVVYTYDKSAC